MIELGRVFADDEVAALYEYRAPYPPETFIILERLVVGPRVVLDAGAGTGAIARHFPPSITRIDAVDPSAAMIARGRALPGGDDPRINWILGRADQTILRAALAAGIDYPYACASGNCGQCIGQLEAGTVDMLARSDASLSPEQFNAGRVLGCRARPRGDVTITWLGRGRK